MDNPIIAFIFTNYNNSKITLQLVDSLSLNESWDNYTIIIVDNDSNEENISLLKENLGLKRNIHLIFNNENIGYFAGLNLGLDYLYGNMKNITLVVIGNNDLLFPKNFFSTITKNFEIFSIYPVISPDIITLDGFHQNPHVVKKISKLRELIYDLYFSNYFFAKIIKKLAKLTNPITDRRDEEQFDIPQSIYQGYGACYILGPIFLKKFKKLWAPTFLMGEELFLSKQLEDKNYKIYYEPSIKVTHQLHSTMSQVPNKKIWEIARSSHKIYREYVKIWSIKK